MFTFINEIVSKIKKFSHDLWRSCASFFGSLFGVSQPLTDDEKYSFIIALLNGQDLIAVSLCVMLAQTRPIIQI